MEDGILRGPEPLDVPGLAGWLKSSKMVMFNGNIDNKPLGLGVPNLRQTNIYYHFYKYYYFCYVYMYIYIYK